MYFVQVASGKPVFCAKPTDPKVEPAAAAAPEAKEAKEAAPKKEKKPKAEKAAKEPKKAAEEEAAVDIGRLDLRVGHIRWGRWRDGHSLPELSPAPKILDISGNSTEFLCYFLNSSKTNKKASECLKG